MEDIARYIGLDSLHYLSTEGLLEAVGADMDNPRYCLACFNGEYIVPPCAEDGKNRMDESNALTW